MHSRISLNLCKCQTKFDSILTWLNTITLLFPRFACQAPFTALCCLYIKTFLMASLLLLTSIHFLKGLNCMSPNPPNFIKSHVRPHIRSKLMYYCILHAPLKEKEKTDRSLFVNEMKSFCKASYFVYSWCTQAQILDVLLQMIELVDNLHVSFPAECCWKRFFSFLQGFLLVFSVTSKKSFQQIQAIKKEIEKNRGKDVGLQLH